jgi:DNA-binding NtrC family response regulator
MKRTSASNHKHVDGRATVLVVDDDANQLDSICRGVFVHGHRFVRLSSIGEAIDLLSQPAGEHIDIMITDLTQQDGDGFGLIQHARALHPDLPIIAVCGLHTTDEIDTVREAGVLILRRPFHSQRLDEAIRRKVA